MRVQSIATKLAAKYSPKIRWDDGSLESDYDFKQTRKAVRAALKWAAEIAANPYSDAVQTIGEESPLNVGAKIKRAILRGGLPFKD